jgi:hypothetical protein
MATKISEVKAGHTLIADGDFACIPKGSSNRVFIDEKGLLYIKCLHGDHYLEGQVDLGDNLIGLSLPQ